MADEPSTQATTETTAAPRDYFATTRWTVVLQAGRESSPDAAQALEELCRSYWYPLYTFVRRQGHSPEDAEDLTQAFFARFLEKNYLADLRSERGKFRAFLLASLKHFLANEWDKSMRQKRGGGAVPLSLDWPSAHERFQFEPADPASPDLQFDRAWAVTLLERVVTRLRAECEREDKLKLFEELKPALTSGAGEMTHAEAAQRLGMNEGAVRVAVHRLRRRYRELLRNEIAQTLSDPAHIDEELRALFAAFAA